MARDLAERNIDGSTYGFEQWGAKYSLKILAKLSKLFLEPMSIAFTAAKGPGAMLDKDVSPDLVGKAAKAMADRMDEDEVVNLIVTLTSEGVMCDGRKIDFNSHYEGRLDHMFKVLYAALEVQYGNFFVGLIGKTGSKSPNTTQVNPT